MAVIIGDFIQKWKLYHFWVKRDQEPVYEKTHYFLGIALNFSVQHKDTIINGNPEYDALLNMLILVSFCFSAGKWA